MDQPKLERLLRLMKLLTANTTYDIDQLAERLQMSRRTVYRYIDTFREAGFVIKKSGNCIRLDKESPHFRDISQLVHFTEEGSWSICISPLSRRTVITGAVRSSSPKNNSV